MSRARNSKDKLAAGASRTPGRRPRANGASGGEGAVPRIPAGRLPDLAQLTDDELAALIRVAERELSARRDKKRADFFSSLRQQAQALGVAPEEIAAELGRKNAKRPAAAGKEFDRRATVAPKYRNPENPSETWAGRGVKPRWMQALLARGKTMDDFRIAT
ncbi:MAG TPA: H-NS histone family protein [Polyangiaceae bacterium]|nr:H-NS histone family protein [Polyangiaceae bacterium]